VRLPGDEMRMRRRNTVAFIVAFCAAPLAALGQQAAKVYRIAWLSGTSVIPSPVWTEFVAGMRQLGWIEGQNFTVENLRYEGRSERLPAIAVEAVQRKFDLIICAGTPPTTAARDATTTIPIVFYYVGDPVGAGFVASLARPGGNVTGMGGLGAGVYAKMFELLKEVVPAATRVAMLTNPTFQSHAAFGADAESAARRVKVTLQPVELRSPEELDSAFATIARDKVDALLILGQPFVFGQGARIAKMAIEQRLPAMIPFEEVARDGILMSYGSRVVDDARRLPYYVDRILKGANPANLPVEQPSRFYLTINLKTAKAIGVAVPPSLLQRADQLIE
jgi:putative tryptophan/tyrosine transport system substrate-binding protein